ncbi:hypothetical protein FA13DRAFT_1730546 [Coprinellus micaceus]|uniref:Uncharacterized protein n=1 Tax=Coprinellus micaceus TaxID=71717 RepID=A0A4Y7THX3_COPMI|nr:hypothetical protein FA13DRAFT_1730546 [Coprinellus micaceus]
MNFDHLQEVFSLSCRKPFAEIFSMNPARETRFETGCSPPSVPYLAPTGTSNAETARDRAS